MERFVKGNIVVVPFPFSDLSQSKRRPALVVQHYEAEDVLLAQITSQTIKDNYAILLNEADFYSGSLKKRSNIRPNKLFTCSSKIILYRAGSLSERKMSEVINILKQMLDDRNST